MSHFAVIVVIENARELVKSGNIQEEVDKLMAPYMENCCAEPDKMYMKFYDEEDEYLKQYNEDGVERVVMPDGRLLLTWDDEFKKMPTEEERKKDPMAMFGQPRAPEDLPRRKVPFKETFATFEEFVEKWHGRAERDETHNRFGYWQNPNAKWDWYEIGGRWAGFFQLKKGRRGGIGKQYNYSGRLQPGTKEADVCLKNAVDFEAMRKECEDKAAKRFDTVWNAIKGTPEAESWEVVRAGYNLNEPKQIDEARKHYHDQPRVKAFTALGMEITGWDGEVADYQVPRAEYLQKARNNAAVPFAVIRGGQWVEQGKMGWFGMARDEKDPETWSSMVSKMYDELSGETLLVAVDCHI